MFKSETVPVDVARARVVQDMLNDCLERLDCAVDVKIDIHWEVKQVNGTDELVPTVNVSYR